MIYIVNERLSFVNRYTLMTPLWYYWIYSAGKLALPLLYLSQSDLLDADVTNLVTIDEKMGMKIL